MSSYLSGYLGSRNTLINVDTAWSIVAVVFLAVVSVCMFILQPGYIQGLVEYQGFSEEEAGLIASAEMFGLASMAILINLMIRINWRVLCLGFLLVSAIGNFLSSHIDSLNTLIALRYITGLGSGGLMSITFTMMGLTRRADRNMGYIVFCVLLYGALGLWVMPSVLHAFGVKGVLIFFGIFCASGLLFIPFLPCSPQADKRVQEAGPAYPWPTKMVALAGILAYNLAIGIVWVYMFLVGVKAGIGEQSVANILTLSQVFGIGGAFFVVLFELRFGRIFPLIVSILGAAAGIGMILGTPSFVLYAAGVCTFNLLWNVAMPYLMAMLADYDAKGTMVTLGVAMQLLGFAAGPAIAASLLEMGGYSFINSIAIGLFIVSACLLTPGLRLQASRAGEDPGREPAAVSL